jgi:hypothetical protein
MAVKFEDYVSSVRSTMTSIASPQDRHSSALRSRFGVSGLIHTRRIVAPQVGQNGHFSSVGFGIMEMLGISFTTRT